LSFLNTFKNELKLIFTDAAIVITIIGGVILYSFLYPQPYAKKSISELSIAVVDYDKSDISRSIIYKLNSTAQIAVTKHATSEAEAKDALIHNEIKAIVVIPRHFKRDLALNKSPTIAVGADSSYFLIYGGVLEGAMKSILTQSATIKVSNLLKKQVPLKAAKESYAPYSLNVINLFNRNNSYTQYVIPAVFVLILHQIILIGLGILGGGINERMRMKEEAYFKDAEVWQMFFSRILIFGAIFFVHMLFYFGYSFVNFDVTRLASITDLLTFGVVFLLASISFGIFLGSLFTSRESATPVFLFSSLPIVFSAGFIWPIESMPSFIHYLSLLIPATSAIHGFVSLNQLGADFSMIIDSYALLCVQAVVYLVLAFFIFKHNRKKCYTAA
jgi:ABC-2 type transport system permease protein